MSAALNYSPKVVRAQPTDGSERLVGLLIDPNKIDVIKETIKLGIPMTGNIHQREELIVPNPFYKVLKTVAVHDCLNPSSTDSVKFLLDENWDKTNEKLTRNPETGELEMKGEKVLCVARPFEIPYINAVHSLMPPMRPAHWRMAEQMWVRKQDGSKISVCEHWL